MKINITGATGNLGTKITEEAIRHFAPDQIVVSVRTPRKAARFSEQGIAVRGADYNHYDELVEAFRDTDVLIYIPSTSYPNPVRIGEFENAVEAAEKAGVKQFIFIGFVADHENNPFKMSPFFGYAARRLASSDLQYTLIRDAMYADPLVPYLPELAQRGRLLYPAGEGKISFISRADLAKAIVRLASTPEFYGGRYTLTGKQAYSMAELAEILSRVSGSLIRYEPMTAAEFAAAYDEPEGFGKILASLYAAAQRNLMGEVTEDYHLLTGEQPEDLESYLARNYK